MSKCHPDRKVWARDMCKSCYNSWYLKRNPKLYEENRSRAKKWRENNHEVNNAKKRPHYHEHIKNNPEQIEKRRNQTLKCVYGITSDGYDILLKKQNAGCAICGQKQYLGKKRLNVDHDHITGKVRGIICHSCNWYLGKIDKDPTIIDKIITYRKQT